MKLPPQVDPAPISLNEHSGACDWIGVFAGFLHSLAKAIAGPAKHVRIKLDILMSWG
jgi:hypothetical protein